MSTEKTQGPSGLVVTARPEGYLDPEAGIIDRPLTFFLEKNIDTFANWLYSYSQIWLSGLYHQTKSGEELTVGPFKLFGRLTSGYVLGMEGFYTRPRSPEGTETVKSSIPLIEFQLQRLAEEQTEVQAQIHTPEVLIFFLITLADIATRSPEARAQISSYAQRWWPKTWKRALERSQEQSDINWEPQETGEGKNRKVESELRNYGPTEKVQNLAEDAKRRKEKTPTLSMMDVAMEIGTTPDAIRYAYRVMGWRWERADRVRKE